MTRSVFISSTSLDLTEYREAASKVISRLDLRPIDMLNFGSAPGGASGVSLKEVGKADIFVGIIARRYGYVPEGHEISVTEQEYDEAVRRGIPRLMYLLDSTHDWPADRVQGDATAQVKLAAFRAKVEKNDVRSLFTTSENLAAQLTADLTKLLDKQRRAMLLTRLIAAGVIVLALIALVLVADPGIRSDLIEIAGLASPTPTPTLTYTPTHTPTATATPTQTPTPTATPREGEPAAEGEIVVVVAQFEQADVEVQPAINVLEVLQEAAEQVGGARVIAIGHTISSREEAQQVSEIYGAMMVVYGRVEPGGVRASYEITPRFSDIRHEVEGDFRVSVSDIDNFDVYIFNGMDARYILGLSSGQLHYNLNHYDAALTSFNLAEGALSSDRIMEMQGEVLYVSRGRVYYSQREYDLAMADYNHAIELNPSYAHAHVGRGNVSYDQRNFEVALAEYNRAIELDPNFAIAYNNRGTIYYKQRDYEAALAEYNRAIELDPDDSMAHNNRGNVYYDQRNYELALADFNQAIELDPDSSMAHNNRGNVYYDQRNYELALADYNRAIELNPENAGAYGNRGGVYYANKDYEAAMVEYNRAIELDPEHANIYMSRGNVYYSLRDYESALADYNRAIELDPHYSIAYMNRGNIYYDRGDYEVAFADYNRAIELNPDYPIAYMNRGNVYYMRRDYEAAVTDYRLYSELAGVSADPDVIQRLHRLENTTLPTASVTPNVEMATFGQ